MFDKMPEQEWMFDSGVSLPRNVLNVQECDATKLPQAFQPGSSFSP